jgi:hypothetical protein
MMILTENAVDPVAEACAAFVCAAAESAEGYTPEQLTEMVTEAAAEMSAILDEAGGGGVQSPAFVAAREKLIARMKAKKKAKGGKKTKTPDDEC